MNSQHVIEQAKNIFHKSLHKGKLVELSEIISFDTEEFEDLYIHLKDWYQYLIEFKFVSFEDHLEEIIIHSPTHISYIDHKGIHYSETDMTTNDLQAAYEVLCLRESVDWNFKKPFVSFDTNLHKKKVRISLIHHSCSPQKRSKCFIRILNSKALSLQHFQLETQENYINNLIVEKKNILICGSTGSGKTTFLNALIQKSNPDEHVIILEDIDEIQIPHSNTTKLLANEDHPAKTLNALMKDSLRMSPKRILIGEIRSHEVETFLLAMNTGHKGLMGTIHANNAKEAIERVALLFKIYSAKDLSYELVLKLVCNNIDNVVFLENKKVQEIIQVYGSEKEQIYFESIQL